MLPQQFINYNEFLDWINAWNIDLNQVSIIYYSLYLHMVLTKEAQEARPKKPMNVYMRFRNDKLHEYKDKEDRNDIVAKLWKEITEDDKEKLKKTIEE